MKGKQRKLQLNSHLLPMFAKVSKERVASMLWAWTAWRKAVGPKTKPHFTKLVELANKGAKDRGYKDYGEFTRSCYDMNENDFKNKVGQLYSKVELLYKKFHAYIRYKLR